MKLKLKLKKIVCSIPFLLIAYAAICFYPFQLVTEELSGGSDSASYLSHALTIALDFDLDYGNEPVRLFNQGGTVARHPVGSGVLAAPFVFAFGIVDRLAGHPVIENHRDYLYSFSVAGFVFASNFYFLFGLWLYYVGCVKFAPEIGKREFLLVMLGTGISHYALYNGIMSHSFEFFACAIAFYAASALFFEECSVWKTAALLALCGLSVPLNIAVRIGNLNTVLLPQLLLLGFWVLRNGRAETNISGEKNLLKYFLVVFLLSLLFYLPLGLFNLHFYGAPYPTMEKMYNYGIDGFYDASTIQRIRGSLELAPNIFALLFSSEMGLVYSNPVVPFGFLFAVIVAFRNRSATFSKFPFILGLACYAGFGAGVVLWWRSMGCAYGYRFLFPLLPVCLLGILCWKKQFALKAENGIAKAVYILFIALCVNGMASHILFDVNEGLSPKPQTNVYGQFDQFGAPDYQTNLVKSLFEPETYRNLIAKRYIGFIAAEVVMNTSLRDRVPPSFVEKYKAYYEKAPWFVHVQALLVLALWVGWAFLFRMLPKPADRESVRSAVSNCGCRK